MLVALVGQVLAAPVGTGDFTGHYELTKNGPKAFALDVTQKGRSAEVSFSAANEDGSGAAPDGDGQGQLNARGELQFKFTDSFENTGTAVLRRNGKTFQLSMQMDNVAEPRTLVHYGTLTLKRTSAKPQSNDR